MSSKSVPSLEQQLPAENVVPLSQLPQITPSTADTPSHPTATSGTASASTDPSLSVQSKESVSNATPSVPSSDPTSDLNLGLTHRKNVQPQDAGTPVVPVATTSSTAVPAHPADSLNETPTTPQKSTRHRHRRSRRSPSVSLGKKASSDSSLASLASSSRLSQRPPIRRCGCNWRAGHKTVFGLRVTLAVFCIIMLSVASLILGLGVKYYLEFRNLLEDDTGTEEADRGPPNFSMVPIYLLLVVGVLITVTSFCGAIGTYVGDHCFLMSYVVLLSIIIFFLFIFIFIDIFFYHLIEDVLTGIFKDYALNLYGTAETGIAMLDTFIDDTQTYHECCGFHPHTRPSNLSKSNVWLNILFWTDSSNWGQLKAFEQSFDDEGIWEWVPKTCCRNRAQADCNMGLKYFKRLNWDDEKEEHYTSRIWTKHCDGHALNFNALTGGAKAMFMFILIVSFGALIASMVITMIIYYNYKPLLIEKLKIEYNVDKSKRRDKRSQKKKRKEEKRKRKSGSSSESRSKSRSQGQAPTQSVAITIEREPSADKPIPSVTPITMSSTVDTLVPTTTTTTTEDKTKSGDHMAIDIEPDKK